MRYEEWLATQIVCVPERCGGRPVFKGTRLWVRVVATVATEDGAAFAAKLYGESIGIEEAEHSIRWLRENPHDDRAEVAWGIERAESNERAERALARMRTLLVLRTNGGEHREAALDDALTLELALNELEDHQEVLRSATSFDFGGYVALRIVPAPPAEAEVWRVRKPNGDDIDPRLIDGKLVFDFTKDEAIDKARELAAARRST